MSVFDVVKQQSAVREELFTHAHVRARVAAAAVQCRNRSFM